MRRTGCFSISIPIAILTLTAAVPAGAELRPSLLSHLRGLTHARGDRGGVSAETAGRSGADPQPGMPPSDPKGRPAAIGFGPRHDYAVPGGPFDVVSGDLN